MRKTVFEPQEPKAKGVANIRTTLYDTVIFNKEHLYSKIFTRAEETYITSHLNLGVVTPLTKPSPTPLFTGGSIGV